MTTIYHDDDADLSSLSDARVAVVGYGNQGRSWALNLRDSGLDVQVCVRADATREQAEADGFTAADVEAASDADVVCVLVPDDVIPSLPLRRRGDGLTVVASGYTVAFERFAPEGDVGMVAPRMLGPEVRRCYEEGIGFITAVGVQRDVTGGAWRRVLAVAKAIGGLRQGAIELTPTQEAILDLAVEQALSPALGLVNNTFVQVMVEHGIPLEAIITELVLSGEFERTMRLVREGGYAAQFEFHSPTSQYGQLIRRGAYAGVDVGTTMRELSTRSRRVGSPMSGTASATPAIRTSWSSANAMPAPRFASSRRRCAVSSARARSPAEPSPRGPRRASRGSGLGDC